MNKITTVVSLFVLLLSAVFVFAVSRTEAQGTNSQQGAAQAPQQSQVSLSPTGNMVQNQVRAQNKGEDTQLETKTQEQQAQGTDRETTGSGKPKGVPPRAETARAHMSNVAAKVEELLTTKAIQGGIGEQIRKVAQEQKTAQNEIRTELGKMDNRNGLLRSVIGPDFNALKNMQKTISQNQLRIRQMTQLQNQLSNQGEITQVQEMIQALTDQNTALQDKINLEEQSTGLFGWLFKLIA